MTSKIISANNVLFSLLMGLVPIVMTSASGADPLPAGRRANLFDDILFRATFDETANADLHKGDPEAKVQGQVKLEEGRFGRAIAVGDEFARVRYTVGSHSYPLNLSCRQGSLSFYFKSIDWAPDEHYSHLVFQVTADTLLRVFSDAGALVFEIGSDLGQKKSLRAALEGSKTGEWIHVVATWSEERIQLFVDGAMAASDGGEDRFLSHVFNTTFDIGDIA